MKKIFYQITGIVLVLVFLINISACNNQKEPPADTTKATTAIATAIATTPPEEMKVPSAKIEKVTTSPSLVLFSFPEDFSHVWGNYRLVFVTPHEPVMAVPGMVIHHQYVTDFITAFFDTPLDLYSISQKELLDVTILYEYVLSDFLCNVYFTLDNELLIKDLVNNKYYISQDGRFQVPLIRELFEGCYIPY